MIDGMDVVAQWVRTSWTKHSRGGRAAATRNAVPVAFTLPDAQLPFVHEVTMDEADDFAPHASYRPVSITGLRLTIGGIALQEADRRLRVSPRDPLPLGAPPRPRRPPAVRLLPGQWLRWQLNYRASSATGMGDWTYHLHTLNLAYGHPSADRFLGTPDRHVDELAHLR